MLSLEIVIAKKITSVSISIPYKGPGNIISHKVLFDVYSIDGHYKAVPCLNGDERRVADLPQELLFNYENGKPFSHLGLLDGNFHTVEEIVCQLQQQKLIQPNILPNEPTGKNNCDSPQNDRHHKPNHGIHITTIYYQEDQSNKQNKFT